MTFEKCVDLEHTWDVDLAKTTCNIVGTFYQIHLEGKATQDFKVYERTLRLWKEGAYFDEYKEPFDWTCKRGEECNDDIHLGDISILVPGEYYAVLTFNNKPLHAAACVSAKFKILE